MRQQLIAYKTFQQRMIELQKGAVDWGMQHHPQVFLRAARKLGLLAEDNQLAHNSDSEIDILLDGFIYEEKAQQLKIIAGFLAGYTCKDQIDRQLVQAMRTAKFGLYRVEALDAEYAKIELTALLPEMADTTLININFARSAHAELILALRILELPEFAMSTGVLFPFAVGKEQRLMREWWKKQGLERYAHFFKLAKKEEITTIFR